MPRVVLFTGATGMNNKVDPVRLRFSQDTGVTDLSVAINVDIDDTGRVGRSDGYSIVRSGSIDSIWGDGESCLFVANGTLYELLTDYSERSIRSGMTPGASLSAISESDETGMTTIYYTNGFQNGFIRNGVNYEWVGNDYVGPPVPWNISKRPPIGHLLEILGARMLVAHENVLYLSMPFAYSWYRLAHDRFAFDSRITAMKALDDGLWISDEKGTYWLQGLDPKQWQKTRKTGYPIIPGTMTEVDGEAIGEGSIQGYCALWVSNVKGESHICVGGPQGYFKNITSDKLSAPSSTMGSASIVSGNYLCTLEP